MARKRVYVMMEGIKDGVSVIDERISEAVEGESHNVAPAKPVVELSGKGSIASLLHVLLRNRELSRVISFLFAGGVSAAVTITVTKLFFDVVLHNLGAPLHFLLSAVVGTEVGILVNFAINDHLAFHDLSGHKRRLPIRLLRFHVTCATGQSLILLISWILHDVVGLGTVVAQSMPIVLVTGINFALHRFWTYRGVHTKPHAE